MLKVAPVQVDSNAAAIAESEIQIHAPLERVWRIQTDIDRWSEWNSDVQRSKLDGPFMVGSVFRWKSGGVPIVSTLRQIESLRAIAWTGKAFGVRAVHTWTFQQERDTVLASTRESFDGWWPRLLPGVTRRMLETSLAKWLQNLKRIAESGGKP
jgi:hypothetical protein